MEENHKKRRVIVMGIGNLLLKDDGIGVHALRVIQEKSQPPPGVNVELIDCGTIPDLAVFMDPGVDKLIIIDAVQARGKPGSIYRFTPDILESEGSDVSSAHSLSIRESLAMMRISGTMPAETVIIGVEPKEMGWGVTLSSEVEEKLPEVVNTVLLEITLSST
jgi:hydrogenase maturation protease